MTALNFYRARFWCRYVCSLGALLGLVGKNPLVRLRKDEEQCNNCRLCLADRQGGAISQKLPDWKPAECFFCCNCISACPSWSISLTAGLAEEKREEKTNVETLVSLSR